MYTGIIQALCSIISLTSKPGLVSFVVEFPDHLLSGLQTGASVAIDGVCFTVTHIDHNRVSFDAMQETLQKWEMKLEGIR